MCWRENKGLKRVDCFIFVVDSSTKLTIFTYSVIGLRKFDNMSIPGQKKTGLTVVGILKQMLLP